MVYPVEILVHISGQSRVADDARYRKEVSRFLNFQSAERYTLLGIEDVLEDGEAKRRGSVAVQTEEQERTHSSIPGSTAETEHTLFTRHTRDTNESQNTESALCKLALPPMTTPSTSKPAGLSILERTSVKETPHLLIARTPATVGPRPRTAFTEQPTIHQSTLLRRTKSDSWQTPPSVIPNSQPTPLSSNLSVSETSSSPSFKRPFELSNSPSPTRLLASPPTKRPRLEVPSSPVQQEILINIPLASSFASHVSSSPPPQPQEHTATIKSPKRSSVSVSSTRNPLQYPLEIHPPLPKASTTHFKTHLTHSLRLLTTRLPLSKYFHSYTATLTRSLQILERGHWLIVISKFPPPLLNKFWEFLSEYVGEGRAGWGTWCYREKTKIEGLQIQNSPTQDHENPDDGMNARKRDGEQEVAKIYCWGEVVREVWLVLFIASERKVLGSGARWIDAGGKEVVVMK